MDVEFDPLDGVPPSPLETQPDPLDALDSGLPLAGGGLGETSSSGRKPHIARACKRARATQRKESLHLDEAGVFFCSRIQITCVKGMHLFWEEKQTRFFY